MPATSLPSLKVMRYSSANLTLLIVMLGCSCPPMSQPYIQLQHYVAYHCLYVYGLKYFRGLHGRPVLACCYTAAFIDLSKVLL